MDKDIVSVTPDGQLTLPAKIRKELKIGKGSKLVVTMEKRYIF